MKTLIASALGTLFLVAPVQAQLLTNPVQDYINKTTLLNNILSNQRAIEMSQKQMLKGKSRPGASAKKATTVDVTTFKPLPNPILPTMIAARSGKSESEKAQIQKFMAAQVALYQQTARKDGFPPNDLAYAFMYSVVNNYITYNNLYPLPVEKDPFIKHGYDSFERISLAGKKEVMMVTPSQERAVFQQFKTRLASNPQIKAMSNQQKQELTEMLAIQFGMSYVSYMNGVKNDDDTAIESARQMAKTNLEKLLGAPVSKIKISAYGVQP